jgi:hypothetical protein
MQNDDYQESMLSFFFICITAKCHAAAAIQEGIQWCKWFKIKNNSLLLEYFLTNRDFFYFLYLLALQLGWRWLNFEYFEYIFLRNYWHLCQSVDSMMIYQYI